jgi:hypothetical protein
VEAAEMCLGVIGAFSEEFGCQNAETQKLKSLVKKIMVKPVSTGQDTLISGPPSTEASVWSNLSEASMPQNGAGDEILNRHEALDEDGLKTLIVAGNVEVLRIGLVLMAIEDPVILRNLLLKAFVTTEGSVTFERTEIIRLLILSGSGCETYRFSSSYLMSFAIEVGNIPLVELIMKKEKKKGSELYGHRHLCIAIERGYEELVKVLLKYGGDVNKRDQYNGGATALCIAALHGKDAIARYLLSVGASVKY